MPTWHSAARNNAIELELFGIITGLFWLAVELYAIQVCGPAFDSKHHLHLR
jgi:hypothetical protein